MVSNDLIVLKLLMVLPRTKGIRGRGTLLKKEGVRKLSGGLIGVICALFSIGLTLEGLSLSYFGQRSLNVLSIIGIVIGTLAILGGIQLWREGRKLQHYRKPSRPVTNRFKMHMKKITKGKKSRKNKKDKESKKSKKNKSNKKSSKSKNKGKKE